MRAKHWKELMVVMTRMYRVVGMIWGHLIRQNTCRLLAPSTSEASTRELSTLERADTYSTMGWPTEVVSRIRMMHHRAYWGFPNQLMFLLMMPVFLST